MRRTFALFAALLLMGCTSGTSNIVRVGPDPQAGTGFRYEAKVNGAFEGQGLSGIIDPATGREIALTTAIRGQGKANLTIRASLPILTIDGDANFIVEPVPGREAEAQAAHARGEFVILRAGVPGTMNRPGTMDAVNAMPVKPEAEREPTIVIESPYIPPATPQPETFPEPKQPEAPKPGDPQPPAGGGGGNACGGTEKPPSGASSTVERPTPK